MLFVGLPLGKGFPLFRDAEFEEPFFDPPLFALNHPYAGMHIVLAVHCGSPFSFPVAAICWWW